MGQAGAHKRATIGQPGVQVTVERLTMFGATCATSRRQDHTWSRAVMRRFAPSAGRSLPHGMGIVNHETSLSLCSLSRLVTHHSTLAHSAQQLFARTRGRRILFHRSVGRVTGEERSSPAIGDRRRRERGADGAGGTGAVGTVISRRSRSTHHAHSHHVSRVLAVVVSRSLSHDC